jgi:chromatin segregation and condensation protein Rec8/ScpA/Scc1 (kleisin family)
MERQAVWTRQEEEDALKKKPRAEWIAEEEALKRVRKRRKRNKKPKRKRKALLARNCPCAHFIP